MKISFASPQAVSLQSVANLTLGLLSNPYILVVLPSRGLASLSRVCRAPQGLFIWFSFHSNCQRSAAALSNSLKCFSSVPNNWPDVGIWPLLHLPHPLRCRASSARSPPLFLFLSLSFWALGGYIYIPFLWSETSVSFQLAFCKMFCIWGCIPDASVERDVLHIH